MLWVFRIIKEDNWFNELLQFYISIGVSVGGLREFDDNCVSDEKPKPWRNGEVKVKA